MDAIECLLTRASVRSFFSDKPVKEEDLNTILSAGIAAPSAGNRQPWKIYVVRDSSKKHDISEAAYGQSFIEEAPVVLVVVALPVESASRYGARGESLYSIQDTAAMTENILLAAHALGYGSCWVGAFDEERVRKILALQEKERPVSILPIGVPQEKPKKPARKPLNKVVVWQ